MGIGSYDRGILKTAFYPVAQFNKHYIPIHVPKREEALIQVPVYVLIDYNTISAPERDLLSLKKSGRATFIGSNTAGAAGFVCKTKITDSITLHYTTGTGQKASFDDSPMSYQGTGIAPDIYAYPTPQGVAEGRDEVLEKAIEVALKRIND
jgi:C-terminal processing protease CtpA/Prc